MSKEKIKVYLYTRVSTSIQIDGYSLEAQKSRMKAFALYKDYEIVGEYEDAGKSGKSIEGRVQFTRMMEDIKSGKDGVSFVLVFKLSRFERNAAVGKGQPKIKTAIDACEMILTLAPETNGHVAKKAWQALGKATGRQRDRKSVV